MLTTYQTIGDRLHPHGPARPGTLPVWCDLLSPTPAEETEVEALLGIDVPTREDMEEIELSSRIYAQSGALYLTANVLSATDTLEPVLAPVTFVLMPQTVVTVRYHAPRALTNFAERAGRSDLGLGSAEAVLLGLLDALVDRVADLLEHEGKGIDAIARSVFSDHKGRPRQAREFGLIMERIGQRGELNAKIRESLVTFERIAGAVVQHFEAGKKPRDLRARAKTLMRDVRSLADHAGFHASRITFLLDATLGLVGIEQNGIIKIFSVAAVVFLPPTLIASIYGMNFEAMPELGWPFGYPLALGLMVISAILPYWYFKRRGWL